MSSPDAPPEAEPEAPPEDKERATVLEALRSELGDAVVASEIRKGDLWVRVQRNEWRRTAEVCRSLGFDYFCFLSGIDWMPHTWPNPKVEGEEGEEETAAEAEVTGESPAGAEAGDVDTDPGLDTSGELDTEEGPERPDRAGDTGPERPDRAGDTGPERPDRAGDTGPAGPAFETGYAGGESRFQVLARLYSVGRKLGLTLKADLDSERPRVETWSAVYPGADWHERETWEMYGFDFEGHPNQVHLYLPGEFEGFPLRKDFPLLAREVKPWPGLVDPEPMPEDSAATDGDAATGEDGAS